MRQILLLFLIISSLSFGQTKYDKHDELISEANTLRKNGDCKQAIEKYKNALEILIPNSSTPFFNLAECALSLNNLALADKWIRKGVSVGGSQKSYLNGYEGFANIQEKDFFKQIVSDYNKLRQEYFSSIDNIDLYLQIEELTARDQFVRKIDDYINGRTVNDMENAMKGWQEAKENNDTIAAKKYKQLLFPKPNEEYKKLQDELMRKVDSLNIERLMEITKEHGWQEKAWIILWHQRGTYGEDNYVWNYFKPLIDKEIEDGKLSRNFWSAFEQFKELMESGNLQTIQVGDKPKKEIKIKKEKIKG